MPIGLSPLNNRAACNEMRSRLGGDHMELTPWELVIPEERQRTFTDKDVEPLMDSIREVGLIQPIGVRRIPGSTPARYSVIYGARRARAFQLLYQQAMDKVEAKKAKGETVDTETNNEVFQFERLHGILYRPGITDEDARELEIRENLDRKELNARERQAHTMLLASNVKERICTRKHIGNSHVDDIGKGDNSRKHQGKNGKLCVAKPVLRETAKAMGVTRTTVESRVQAARHALNKPDLDLERSSSQELEQAGRELLEKSNSKRTNSQLPMGFQYVNGHKEFTAKIDPANPARLVAWFRRNHPVNVSLDQIKALRDGLSALIDELSSK